MASVHAERLSFTFVPSVPLLDDVSFHLPAGWTGGDRIAIHGTNDPGSIGVPSSAGCPHASDEDMRFLMARVPLGTPVLIHP